MGKQGEKWGRRLEHQGLLLHSKCGAAAALPEGFYPHNDPLGEIEEIGNIGEKHDPHYVSLVQTEKERHKVRIVGDHRHEVAKVFKEKLLGHKVLSDDNFLPDNPANGHCPHEGDFHPHTDGRSQVAVAGHQEPNYEVKTHDVCEELPDRDPHDDGCPYGRVSTSQLFFCELTKTHFAFSFYQHLGRKSKNRIGMQPYFIVPPFTGEPR